MSLVAMPSAEQHWLASPASSLGTDSGTATTPCSTGTSMGRASSEHGEWQTTLDSAMDSVVTTPRQRGAAIGWSSAESESRECQSTPIVAASPSSTRSRIAPSRFSNIAHFWHQRASGMTASPVSLLGGSTAPGTPSIPTLADVTLEPDQLESQLTRASLQQEWSPEGARANGPTPMRLVNLLEGGPSSEYDTSASWSSTPYTPGSDESLKQQRLIGTPSTSSTQRGSARSLSCTASYTNIMSIATPQKFTLDSPGDSKWGGETEMELMLDLANHVPSNMLDRINDIGILHSASSSLFTEEENQDRDFPTLIWPAAAAIDPVAASSCLSCRHSLLAAFTIAAIGLCFAAGFVVGGGVHLSTSRYNSSWSSSEMVGYAAGPPLADRRLIEAVGAVSISGTGSEISPLNSNFSSHDADSQRVDHPSSFSSKLASEPAPQNASDELTHSPFLAFELYMPEDESGTQGQESSVDTTPTESSTVVGASPEEAAATARSSGPEDTRNTRANALAAASLKAKALLAFELYVPGAESGIQGQNASVDATRTELFVAGMVPEEDAVASEERRTEFAAPRAERQFQEDDLQRLVLSSARAAPRTPNGALSSHELEQHCLAAAASFRASGAAVKASRGHFFAEEACHVAALGARGRERAVERKEDS